MLCALDEGLHAGGGEDGAEAGKTRRDDGDAGLDESPVEAGCFVVYRIVSGGRGSRDGDGGHTNNVFTLEVGGVPEVDTAEDTRDDGEGAEEENAHHCCFLGEGELESQDGGDWEGENEGWGLSAGWR